MMSMRWMIVLLAAVSMSAFVGCASDPAAKLVGNVVTIKHETPGNDPALKDMGPLLVNSQAELDALGATEVQTLAQPNFETDSLVIVAIGEQETAGFWARIDGAQVVDGKLRVQATINAPAADAVAAQQVTHAFSAAVISKVSVSQDDVILEGTSVSGQSR